MAETQQIPNYLHMAKAKLEKEPEFVSLAEELKAIKVKIEAKRLQMMSSPDWALRVEEERRKKAERFECPDCEDTETIIKREPVLDEQGNPRMTIRSGDGVEVEMVHDVGYDCHCKPRKQARRFLEASGISEEFRRRTFQNYYVQGKHALFTEALKIARDFADRFDELRNTDQNWLMLMGEPGAGKTHLVIAVANYLLDRPKPVQVIYFQHREEFDRLKANNWRDADDVFERLKRCRGLVIWDDFLKTMWTDQDGRRQPDKKEQELSWTVINYRAFNGLPTAISTEWRPAELASLDRSFAGRILQRAKAHHMTFRLTKEEIDAGMKPITTFDHRFME